jgi:uncharacterized integral membrane protein
MSEYNAIPGDGNYVDPIPTAPQPDSTAPRTPGPIASPAVPHRTRISTAWVALIGGAIALVLLLVFVMQNSTPGRFNFLGLHFTLPLGVAVLLAAVIGVLVTAAIGTARIRQVRHTLRRTPRTRRR